MSSVKKSGSGSMEDAERGMFERLIEALSDKHSQLDLNFQRVSLRLPGMQQLGVELNGTVTLSVHMRDLTDQEKETFAAKNPELITEKL
jgi:hypothetical protein